MSILACQIKQNRNLRNLCTSSFLFTGEQAEDAELGKLVIFSFHLVEVIKVEIRQELVLQFLAYDQKDSQ